MTRALVSFFAIIDPLGSLLIFHLYTQSFSWRTKCWSALVATGVALLMLVGFSFGGDRVLDLLGISPASFRIAAGLLLLLPAYKLIMEGQPADPTTSSTSPLDFALVPLATPLIAGPGALAATISLTQAVGRETTIAAVSIVLLVTMLSFAAADWLFRLAGASVLRLLTRIVGLVLFAIAVDFVMDGIQEFIRTTSALSS